MTGEIMEGNLVQTNRYCVWGWGASRENKGFTRSKKGRLSGQSTTGSSSHQLPS